MTNTRRLYHLKDEVLEFLGQMRSEKTEGYYRYSYSGDLYDEKRHWNVGSSVFALKIYYTLGVQDNKNIERLAEYIKSFRHEGGLIYDDLVLKKAFVRNLLSSLRQRNFSNIWNQQYKRAETRQCYSALMLYDKLPDDLNLDIPCNEKEIDAYLSVLDWSCPWGAGSHFSHLMFFLLLALKAGKIESGLFERLTDYSIKWVNRLQHPEDGSWFSGDSDIRQKINGAMKVITGLIAIDKPEFDYPEKLIDLCLSAKNNENACDNFNIIFVINYAAKLTGRAYRQDEIEDFALKRLNIYWQYYYDDKNGFSFHKGKANEVYYGARISRGINEPDIHGTVLFLWGISIIVQILGIEAEFEFQEFKT